MAQLKDSVVSGSMRVTDTLYDDTTQTRVLQVPTEASATTYGPGTDGQVIKSNGTNSYWSTPTTTSVGSATAGTAIPADDITAWTTNTPTAVTKKTVVTGATFNTVVTGGTTTAVPNISKKTVVTGVTKKTVVTSASGATATYADGILTLTDGSFSTGDSVTVSTGDSVTVGTAINAYTTLTTGVSGSATTGDSVTVTAGTAASLSYTAKSIPNISVSSKTVLTGV